MDKQFALMFLDKFTNEEVKEIMKSNFSDFEMQKLNLEELKEPAKNQIEILKRLKKEIISDKNFKQYSSNLIEIIDDKIKMLKEIK